MKKIILYLLSIILLIAAGFWAYLLYSRWHSFRIEMPANADRVVRINLEKISKRLISSKNDKDMEVGKLKDIRSAFKIPFNVFAFGNKSVSNTAFYTKLEIENNAQFEQLKKQYFVNSFDSFSTNSSASLSIISNEKEAVLIWGKDTSAKVLAIAKDYLNNKNSIAFSSSKLSEIKSADADVSSLGNMYNFNVNFEPGAISGTFINNIASESPVSLKVPKDAALAVIAKENFFSLLDKFGFKELMPNVKSDELFKVSDYGFALYINGEAEQQKLSSTYDYDDNFEKVEVNKLETIKVPSLNIKIPLLNNQALATLKTQQLLINNDSVNNNLFPLFNLKYFVKNDNNVLFIHSSQNLDTAINNVVQLSDVEDFMAWANFQSLAKMNAFEDLKNFLIKFDQFKVKHIQGEQYSFDLSFMDKKTSSIKQLIKLFS